jgi:Glycosyltransferase like family 2
MAPLATLAVISHERAELRDRAIESALRSIERSRADLPILVIDSSRTARPVPDGVQLVHRPDEPSCVSKRRLAVELSETDWVILLDDDCQALPEAVTTLLAAMESEDHHDTAALFVATEFTGPRTRMFDTARRSDLAAGFGETTEGDVVWGVTTLSAFRRHAIITANAFRKEHISVPVGGEDVDACIRLRAAGWRLRNIPDLLALHDIETWNSFRKNARRSRNYGAAEAELVRLHVGHARIGYENPVTCIALALLGKRLVTRRSPTVWPAVLAGLIGWTAGEFAELRSRNHEASGLDVMVQTGWSVAYEYGRLRTAMARRAPHLLTLRFNWEEGEPAGFSLRLPSNTAVRLAVTGAAATAIAIGLQRVGDRR